MRSILALKALSLSQVSQRSEALYGRASPYFIPHNFYYDLRSGSFSPSIHQLVALSFITGYRLAGWVRVFGANLEDIVRLQAALPSNSTILLDSSLTDPYAWVRWVQERTNSVAAPPIAPLGQLVRFSGYRQIRSLSESSRPGFLYVKIGQRDAIGFPDFVPGSLVRVNTNLAAPLLPHSSGPSSRHFLIEHSQGLFCCRLRAIGNGAIVPVSRQLSYAQVELHPHETRLLGVADLEIRPLSQFEAPTVPIELARHWTPRSLSGDTRVGTLLHRARTLMRLSLREASTRSRKIADLIGDERYFISPSSLCDYELANSAPRRVQTVITLCSLYGLQLRAFLKAGGINLSGAGDEPIPEQFGFPGPHAGPHEEARKAMDRAGFVAQLLERSEDIPFFLRQCIGSLSGLEDISLGDFFWIGGDQEVLHPYLAHGLLAIVNRRRRRPMHFPSKPLCQQPVYALLRRDGSYLCACCGVENGSLVVHPYSKNFHRADVFRYRQDVEVIGQIVMIARKLP
jgi:hypothetical protein